MHYQVIVDRLRASGDVEAADRLADAYKTIDALYHQNKELGDKIVRVQAFEDQVRDALSNLVGAASDCIVPNAESYDRIMEVTTRRRDMVDLMEARDAGQEVLRKWWPDSL